MKRVLVACGTALATSTIVAKKIEELCTQNDIQCMTFQCKADDALSKIRTIQPNIVVTTAEIKDDLKVPILDGKAFLTGVGLEEVTDELIRLLKK